MKKIILALSALAIMSTGFLQAQSLDSDFGITFGTNIKAAQEKLEKDNWTKVGVDPIALGPYVYTTFYTKENANFEGASLLQYATSAAYSDDSVYISALAFAANDQSSQEKLSEIESSIINKYSFTKGSYSDYCQLSSDLGQMTCDESFLNSTDTGVMDKEALRYYKAPDGNNLIISAIANDEGAVQLVTLIYGAGPDFLKAEEKTTKTPVFDKKALKESSEVFCGIPFGTSIVDTVKKMKSDDWSIVTSQQIFQGINGLYFQKENSKFEGIDTDCLITAFADDSFLLGIAWFENPDEAKRAEIGKIEEKLIKKLKLKPATKEEIDNYSAYLNQNLWDEKETNQSKAGEMTTTGTRLYKSKSGTLIGFFPDTDSVLIMQI
nr:hypothetical protein [Treponema sp.]